MIELPLELSLKILTYLSKDFKTLEALRVVFPDDSSIEQASQAYQAIVIGRDELLPSESKNLGLPTKNVHRGSKILAKEGAYFPFPVKHLWLFLYPKEDSHGHEGELKVIHQILKKEPHLLQARKVEFHGEPFILSKKYFDSELTKKRVLDFQKKVFFDFNEMPNGVASNYVTKFPKLKELKIVEITLLEIPELLTLKSVDLEVGSICDINNLNKLVNLKQLLLSQSRKSEYGDIGMRLDLPQLEYLKLGSSLSTFEDHFDESLPNLKTLDLSGNKLERVPIFSGTKLEELQIKLEQDCNLENLSSLINLKKLVVEGEYFTIDGISELQNLQHLELKTGASATIELDRKLPRNLRVLSINGFKIEGIKDMPVNLQDLKLDKVREHSTIDGISELQNLQYLELKTFSSSTIDLDRTLPRNLRVLSVYGFQIKEIKNMPDKLQELKLDKVGEQLKIENINAELSVLEVFRSHISEINCDLSSLKRLELSEKQFRPKIQTFIFTDKTSSDQDLKELRDYCHHKSIKFKFYDTHKHPT